MNMLQHQSNNKNRSMINAIVLLGLLTTLLQCSNAVEFTFDLADNAEDCFYEEIKRNTSAYFEFQVSAGGQLDVDVVLKDPNNQIIYSLDRATFDSHQFTAETTGVYTACFSNKFSAFSHKIVYVDFQVGEEQALPGVDEHATVLTQMETSSQAIHKGLNDILDAQTHHRLREAQGFKRAELINQRVMVWASLETASVVLIGLVQILILRNFFTDRKPSQTRYERL
ncbi:transmembrane emp24 domain-containing protein 7 [Drosophila sulfurigaster albostrigata]|uniref:transmembrane emp24 domain-containing protein 7 n=1 Tax=Drosophila sulfurigaster albostrigata TaxID=89887 RepID=UPI002D2183C8|nr:transmembrane emp24 domain-containing protein 7 [Drosophila sulfurigaster albostrigata]XP_062138126.1 transmembrane emp24 domain-containing protein 7 [Drosophila sulfurigaster albostrigata]